MAGIIRNFLDNFGNLEKTKLLVTPDVTFIGAREQSYPELPIYGTFIGHSGLERFMAGLGRAFKPQLFVIDEEVEEEHVGFVCGRFEHQIRDTGVLLRAHFAIMCRFKDGKIASYRIYEDTAALEEAFGIKTESRETVSR